MALEVSRCLLDVSGNLDFDGWVCRPGGGGEHVDVEIDGGLFMPVFEDGFVGTVFLPGEFDIFEHLLEVVGEICSAFLNY